MPAKALTLIAAPSDAVGVHLCRQVADAAKQAAAADRDFVVALSGGSIPALLSRLNADYDPVDLAFHRWKVILADERCVPATDERSTLKALRENLFREGTPASKATVHGIDESLLGDTAAVAEAYHDVVSSVGAIDLCVLGFGPDGHTCSLFPGRAEVLDGEAFPDALVIPVTDSPKPPSDRVTLTMRALLETTKKVLVCGAGASKAPILQNVLRNVVKVSDANSVAREPAPVAKSSARQPEPDDVPPQPKNLRQPEQDAVRPKPMRGGLRGGLALNSSAVKRGIAEQVSEVVKKVVEKICPTHDFDIVPMIATAELAEPNLEYPIGMVYPNSKELTWLVDEPATAKLPIRYATRRADALVGKTKADLVPLLHGLIIDAFRNKQGDAFTIALSGGSLPALLKGLPKSFADAGVADPEWSTWNVVLADERCVASDHDDSNLKHIRANFLNDDGVSIPESNVLGIDESLLIADDMDASAEAIAKDYERRLRGLDVPIDLCLLGFGPDGHTCSLFPGRYDMLQEVSNEWISCIFDSPKPPPHRITMTLGLLNFGKVHRVAYCGAGGSKRPILQQIWCGASNNLKVELAQPAPFPCGLVYPPSGKLSYIVDEAAMPVFRFAV